MRPRDIKPRHVAAFHDRRGSTAPVSANRELSLLSHVFTKAIRWGAVEHNPCKGIERHTESPRDRYVTHEEFWAVRDRASAPVAIAMDLAVLTGQRQADLLTLTRQQLTEDGILFRPGKTKRSGASILIAWSPALETVVEAAKSLSDDVASMYVICDERGQRINIESFRTAWQRLQRQLFEEGVLKDRFTFHDLRAKAGTDAENSELLGHASRAMFERVYRRKPRVVAPAGLPSVDGDEPE